MSDAPRATLGDAVLDVSAGVGWVVSVGYAPHVQSVTLDAAEAGKVGPGPVTLTVMDASGKVRLKVERLYVVGEAETLDPHRRTLLVADCRIWWARRHVRGSFNARRRTGERRRLSEGGVPQQLQQVADDVAYHPATLRNAAAWKARDVARRVLDVLEPRGWVDNLGLFTETPVEDLDIDADGPSALAQALRYLPGAMPYVGLDGRVRLLDATQVGQTDALVRQLRTENPSFVNGRYPSLSDRSAVRPIAVRILFQVEQEVRFDSLDPGETVQSRDGRWMQFVAPIPDPTLTVSGAVRVSGTYETFDNLFTAWNAAKGDAAVPDITDELLRMFWVSGFPEAYWGGLGDLAPSAVWVERIATCRAHYRQTLRLNRRWVDRVWQFRPYRVSILDQENGLFARAQAFAGYCVVASTKGLLADPGRQFYMRNVDGSVAPGTSLDNGRVAPCIVHVLEPELGIIRLDYQVDLLGHYRQIIPSMVEGVPTSIPSKANNEHPLTMDGSIYGAGGASVTLKESNRVSVVLTCVPAAPNGKAQFKSVRIPAAEAVALLPSGARAYAQRSTGPEWEVRVGGQLATARYAWSDALSGQIEAAMGVGVPVDQSDVDRRDALESLLCNPAELKSLAKSLSASVYAGLVDSWVGDHSCDMNADLVPVGTIRSVAHVLTPEGVLQTTLAMREEQAPYDPMAALPDSARRLFLRTVQP